MSPKTLVSRLMPRRRRLTGTVALLLVLFGALWVGAMLAQRSDDLDSVATSRGHSSDAEAAAGDDAASGNTGGQVEDGAAGEMRVVATPEAAGDEAAGEPGAGGLGQLAAADSQRRLIREGSVTLGYPDTFAAAHREVVDLAQRLGGGVRDVESTTRQDATVRGSVTVQVPVGEYEALLDGIGDVGRVRRRDVRTQDVTEKFVDLQARRRHLERTEQFYLDLFDRAESVDEVLKVREQLDSVQQRLEEIQGRLRHLKQRTEMSRLTVELVPADAELDDTTPVASGFGQYWQDAQAAFVTVTGTLLVVAVGGAPVVLVAALGLAVLLALVRVWRSASVTQPE